MSEPNPESLRKIKNYMMPFGKYRGVTLLELPERYVLWCVENNILKGELKTLFHELYDIKVNGLEALIRKIDL